MRDLPVVALATITTNTMIIQVSDYWEQGGWTRVGFVETNAEDEKSAIIPFTAALGAALWLAA